MLNSLQNIKHRTSMLKANNNNNNNNNRLSIQYSYLYNVFWKIVTIIFIYIYIETLNYGIIIRKKI